MKEIYVHCYLSTKRTPTGFKSDWCISSMHWDSEKKAEYAWQNRRNSGVHDSAKEMIVRIKENGEMSVYKHTLKHEPDLKKIFE